MDTSLPPFARDLGQGVWQVDSGFQRDDFDAAYLVVDSGRAAFIDTGTNHTVPRLLATLAALGLGPDAVDFVIPTHVHLDHAGGAGLLMASLPQARLVVHPRGARHMIDPTALWQGALAVYGAEEMQRAYGELRPVPAERVTASHDGLRLALGGRALELMDTPGHARHHHCVWDTLSRGWFTGDTFGLSYREFDVDGRPWILPTCTPVQFEPGPLRDSIQRLLARDPDWVYLTHYGKLGHVAALGRQLLEGLEQVQALALAVAAARLGPAERHDRLKAELTTHYLQALAAHGCTLPAAECRHLLAMDAELNAQGLAIWLDRRDRPRATAGPSGMATRAG
jgi:glyoxylase-like metal-dependent hydrolase (beta-lactamase superfamily II)